METKILNYRIIIEPDVRTGGNKSCLSVFCPTLGIADSGDTMEEALTNIKQAIEAWIEALVEDGKEVPPADQIEDSFVTFTTVRIPSRVPVAL